MTSSDPKQFTVYSLYAEDDTLLYVGFSKRFLRRIAEHADLKIWWTEVTSARFEHFGSRDKALNREAQLIVETKPLHNEVIPFLGDPVSMAKVLAAAKARDESAALLTVAVRRAREKHSLREIARELGISRQRVHQISNGE